MSSFYWDCHTHPQFSAYDNDREEMLARAREVGVKMIAVGTTVEDSEQAIALAEERPDVVAGATVGVHPTEFNQGNISHSDDRREEESRGGNSRRDSSSRTSQNDKTVNWDKLQALAKHPRVVAVGECGMDFFHADRTEVYERQKGGLLAQIEIANEVGKPLMVHCRNAFDDLLSALNAKRSTLNVIPIIHFFSGTVEHAEQLLELGAYFTFGGVITFTGDYDEQIRLIPKERILSETDAPFVAPAPYRGKRNEPAYVTHVVPRLAELKKLSTEEMKAQIAANVEGLFGLN